MTIHDTGFQEAYGAPCGSKPLDRIRRCAVHVVSHAWPRPAMLLVVLSAVLLQ